MNDENFEGCASFFEKAEREAREARENTRVNLYSCSSKGANILNIYGCAGCQSLSPNPVETVNVPKKIIAEGKEIEYIDKVSRSGISPVKLRCSSKVLKV